MLIVATLLAALVPQEPPPNIIFILADDLGYGELGCFGQKIIKTPRLDRLAQEGMRLTRHYSGSPVCAPSRCVFLTGKHTGHAYIRDNDEMGARGDVWNDPALEGQRPLAADEITIAEILQQRGYATSFVGKWGLGWTGTEGDPNTQGFDHFYGYLCQRVAHNYYPDHLHRNGERVLLPNQPKPGRIEKVYAPDLMIEEALSFVRENQKKPFFLTFATPVPHLALQVPEDSLAEYEHFSETPYTGNAGYLPHEKPRAAYAGMITRMDRDIGRILDLLDDLELTENTMVVFTSDNGPSWIGGVDYDFFESQGGLRGRKAQLYEGGIRVPTIVRWPGKVPPRSESSALSAFWDWMPTFVEVAGILDWGPPSEMDGKSMTSILKGGPGDPDRTLYWEHASRWQAMISGNWKLLRKKPSEAWELYNLKNDPTETKNLAKDMPDYVQELIKVIQKERVGSEIFPMKGFPQDSSWVEFQKGTMPLILSAPHGGTEKPEGIPDRTSGTLVRDRNVREIAMGLADAIEFRTGFRPFVVTTNLHRVKMDANRPLAEAAQGGLGAEKTWYEYHAALEKASSLARELGNGQALLFDIHGHGHKEDWSELAGPEWEKRKVMELGALFTEQGLRAVPSPDIPDPGDKPYFNGGYIVRRHCEDGLRAIQIELPWSLRSEKGRESSLGKLANACADFFGNNFLIPRQDLSVETIKFKPFDRKCSAFGVPIFATKSLEKEKLAHAISVLAEYLDNDENGVVDDAKVLKELRDGGAFLVMPQKEREMQKLFHHFEEMDEKGWRIGQDLYGEETNQPGRFDYALEEIWHLVSQGWGLAYPQSFAFEKGSALCKAMDKARLRGGHYHYDDPTCDYDCQAGEYSYWVLTSMLNAQSFPGRPEEIEDEWECATPELLFEKDPDAWKLFSDEQFHLPRQIPNGQYREDA